MMKQKCVWKITAKSANSQQNQLENCITTIWQTVKFGLFIEFLCHKLIRLLISNMHRNAVGWYLNKISAVHIFLQDTPSFKLYAAFLPLFTVLKFLIWPAQQNEIVMRQVYRRPYRSVCVYVWAVCCRVLCCILGLLRAHEIQMSCRAYIFLSIAAWLKRLTFFIPNISYSFRGTLLFSFN